MPPMPPPPIQPQPALPIPPHGNVSYGGAAQPQQQHHKLPQQQHYVRGVEEIVDYTTAVLQATENAHAGRHRNHQRRNAHAALIPAAPLPNPPIEPNHNHVNVDFQQNIFNFQYEAEEQQWQQLQWEAQQAERQAAEERQQLHLMAEQRERQVAEERQQLEWMAEQAERQAAQEELLRQEADHWHRLAQAEQEHLHQEAEQQCLTEECRECEQQEHLEDLYREHNHLSQQHYEQD
ncbi:hypothetical protein PAXRUDRAFT_18877 [Paxillus rubicundulus Ve08.2h10]|uniref:Uncharacterized protein n=1 Tax=Paxillus rubicundulus Ve08.2h10 TaxID=930991 RepID=A0A0D0D652_9AGAM|nr:hypothetical protein PAXRUDRAFT_18877 [Paxillus rubicundulus Ve08.2h10]